MSLLALFDKLTAMVVLFDQEWKGSLCSIGTAAFPVGHQSFTLTDVPIVALLGRLSSPPSATISCS